MTASELNSEISEDIAHTLKIKNVVYTISDVSESLNYIIFKTNIAIYVYDKAKDELNGFNSIESTRYKIGLNTFFTVGNSSDLVAFTINSTLLENIKNIAKENKKFDNYELLKLAEKVNAEDNPILIISEYK